MSAEEKRNRGMKTKNKATFQCSMNDCDNFVELFAKFPDILTVEKNNQQNMDVLIRRAKLVTTLSTNISIEPDIVLNTNECPLATDKPVTSYFSPPFSNHEENSIDKKTSNEEWLTPEEQVVNVLVADCTFQYSFVNTPLFFTKPHARETKIFDKKLQHFTRMLFKCLRSTGGTSITPDTVIAPELAGMTAGELALIWLQARWIRKRTAKAKRFIVSNDSSTVKKGCHLPVSRKLRKLHTQT